jgi:hypothetical protein
MPEKKPQNEDKQNNEHSTENLKDYQYRWQEKQHKGYPVWLSTSETKNAPALSKCTT